jgi:predicted Zn-dependent protease with MMP-like domain
VIPPILPGSRFLNDPFVDFVRAAWQRLEESWPRQMANVEIAIEQVPPAPASWETGAPVGRAFPAENGLPARIVVYRQPLLARAHSEHELGTMVLDVVVEELAHLLGRRPDEIDPGYNL